MVETVCSSSRKYEIGRSLGRGSFGEVCYAMCLDSNEPVAIKKVLQDPRYKNRELTVMKQLLHPNIVGLKDFYFTETADDKGTRQRYLSLVMEFIPDTVYEALKHYGRMLLHLPVDLVRVYAYQMLRSLGYLHSLGLCHRDIKPQNLLVNTTTHVVKLCDFGSAKRLYPGENSVSYICSRFYRAPELMLGATEYSCAIDTWSVGCVVAEMLVGRPLFAGVTSVDQLVRIIQVLGAPTVEQTKAMCAHYSDFNFPQFTKRSWKKVIPPQGRVPDEIYSLLDQLLQYEPNARLKPYDALAHEFFDELRVEGATLPNNVPVPPLFNFSVHELDQMSPEIRAKCIPPWMAKDQKGYS